jgi:cytochrome c5
MKRLALTILLVSSAFTLVLSTLHAQNKQGDTTVKPTAQTEDAGQKVFEQNCSRCHNAPEGFSPRISGTIVRHMRVRANLSREDEQKLLHFFNP